MMRHLKWNQPTPLLAGCAAGSVLMYVLLLAYFHPLALTGPMPRLALAKMGTGLMVFCMGALGLFYWLGYRLMERLEGDNSKKIFYAVLGFTFLLALLCLFIPPFHSTDVLDYIRDGWSQAHYHLNTYVTPTSHIAHYQNDPMLGHAEWPDLCTIYGFLEALLCRGLAQLGKGHLLITVYYFKTLNFVLHLAITVLVWRFACQANMDKPALSAYAYGCNPLLLLHLIANGHNDILVAFLSMLAIFSLFMESAWLLIPLLIAGCLIKYSPILVVPFAVVYLLRHRQWLGLGVGVLLGMLLIVLTAWPYIGGMGWSYYSQTLGNFHLVQNSIDAALYATGMDLATQVLHLSRDVAFPMVTWLRRGLMGVFFVFYCRQLAQFITQPQTPTRQDFLYNMVLIQFIAACFIVTRFWPWYLGMFFPLACLLPRQNTTRQLIILLSLVQLFTFTGFGLWFRFQETSAIPFILFPTLFFLAHKNFTHAKP